MKHPALSPRGAAVAVLVALTVTLLLAATAQATPMSQKKARLRAVQDRLNEVYTQSEIANEKYAQATTQLESVKAKIAENERQLAAAERNLRRANLQLELRAASIYKTRDLAFVDVLFEAGDFDDLISQLDMMERLGNSDVDTVKSITAYRRDIKDRRVKLLADRQEAARLVADRQEHRDELLALQGRLEQLSAGIKSEIKRLREQQARAARLAAQASWGGISVPPVDPNSPGHPEIVAIAQRYFGVPYVWGGASPSGFDCSGLTMYCYAQIGIAMYHGATVQQQQSTPVALSDMRPGDLVFFGNATFSHHVAIYAGGNAVIEAPHTGDVVRYGPLYGRDAWIGGRF